MAASSYIPESVIQLVATVDSDSRRILQGIQCDPHHPLNADFLKALAVLPDEVVEEVLTDPELRDGVEFYVSGNDPSLLRFEVALRIIDDEIYRRRREALFQKGPETPPYQHPALSGIEPDHHMLVPLSGFNTRLGFMVRNGYVFSPTPPTRSVNSQFWSSRVLFRIQAVESVHIRLDPLLVARREDYRASVYKVDVFGRDLDWERIRNLKGEETARWMPDEMTSEIHFTDLVWQCRDDGVHFECEEIPKRADKRPSRYFHSILDPGTLTFIHTDAAVRFYTQEELEVRKQTHLNHLSKVGIRVKLFRVDCPLNLQTWTTLIAGSFFWNNDIQRYFRAERLFDVEYAPLMKKRA
jgi:hypothetical protein